MLLDLLDIVCSEERILGRILAGERILASSAKRALHSRPKDP
jgi:hypothetical protein